MHDLNTSDNESIDLQELDRQIVLATQQGLPLVSRPYHLLAQRLKVDVELLKSRLRKMLEDKRIRRIGAVPNHYRLGYVANGMSVWDIDDRYIDQAGKLIGNLEHVSHCYERPRIESIWRYNLFAMLHGHRRIEVIRQADEIKELLGEMYRAHDILFSTEILKKTGLRFSSHKGSGKSG